MVTTTLLITIHINYQSSNQIHPSNQSINQSINKQTPSHPSRVQGERPPPPRVCCGVWWGRECGVGPRDAAGAWGVSAGGGAPPRDGERPRTGDGVGGGLRRRVRRGVHGPRQGRPRPPGQVGDSESSDRCYHSFIGLLI